MKPRLKGDPMLKPLRVLVVEDSEDDAELVLLELRRAGFDLTSLRVESADGLRDALLSEPWEVVLVDHSLPGFDAPAALEIVQGNDLDLPVIVVSGTIGEDFAVDMMRAGATDYVLKSNLTRLAMAIEREVRDAGLRRGRRRAEEAMRVSEARFQKMADAVPVIIWVTDEKHSCTYLNQQWYNFTGQSKEAALGFGWLDAIHLDDRPATESKFQAAIQRHESFVLEYRLRAGNGSYWWCMDTGTPQFGEDGNFLGYIGSVVNITDRHQTEEATRASEERLRLALKAGRMATYDWDILTNQIEWSDTHYEMFGYSSEHRFPVEYRHFAERIHPDDLPGVEVALRRAMKERIDYIKEARVLLPDGTVRWVLGHGTFNYDEAGRPVRMLGTAIDITDRRRMEEAIRASEEQLHAVFRTAAAGIAVTATDGRFIRCNTAYCQMVGYSESELQQIDFATLTHPDDRPQNLRLLKDLLEEKIPSFSIEKRYIHKSGSLVWSRVGVSAVRDETGQPIQIIGVAEDVTRQKHAEEELRQNRDYLRMASRVSHVGAWTVELHEPRLIWSEEICTIFEVPVGPAPDLDTAIAFYSPGYREVIRTEFGRCVSHGIPFDLELEIVTATGKRRWVRSIGEAVRNADGSIVRVQGACQDITESKQAREREQRLVARLAETLENISDAFFTLDTNWNITFLNSEVERLTRKNRKELLGANIWSAFPEAMGSAFEQQYFKAVREQVTVEFEEFYASLDTWFAVKAYPTPEGLAVYCKDVTQQKIAEDAVRESAERFRLLARATNDAIWDWNMVTSELWWNEGFETLFGYSRCEVDSSLSSLTDYIHPDDRELVVSGMREAIDGGNDHWSAEYRYRCKKGHYAFVRNRGHIIRDAMEKPVRMIGGMTDLTNLKFIQEDLARSNNDLQQFAYVASHDLQEPLRAVAGCTQLLNKRYGNRLDDHAAELIKHTVEGVERMQTLIHDLLEYSRVSARAKYPNHVNLAQPLKTALANLEASIQKSGASVVIDSLPIVRADGSQMVLLFQNLFSNAIKFCGQQQPRIHVSASRQRGEWLISVVDNGIGIEPEYSARVFILFQRLHTRTEYPGTGIGLALCKKIVERHGGRIWVESTPGEGSKFTFTLPEVEDL